MAAGRSRNTRKGGVEAIRKDRTAWRRETRTFPCADKHDPPLACLEQFPEAPAGGVSTPQLKIDVGAYYTPENSKTGPFIGAEPATVTLTNSILGALVGFSFDF